VKNIRENHAWDVILSRSTLQNKE